MLRVGLTGGIGCGKSSVSRLLASYGAVVVDADLLARQVVEPGTPGLRAVVKEFGTDVLNPDGSLDRDKLGAIVFADEERRKALNAIVHPLIGEATQVELERAKDGDVVVHDVPLLVEGNLMSMYDVVVVVAASPETAKARLVRDRGMTPEAAQARIDAQLPIDAKRAVADVVIENDGPLEELEPQVRRLWADLRAKAESVGPPT